MASLAGVAEVGGTPVWSDDGTLQGTLESGSILTVNARTSDDEAAARSMFGRLSASGWHTCAMAMGLMVRGFLHESSSLGSPGLEKIQWLRPVYPGDTLTLRQTITEARPMASRPEVGLIRSLWEMFNQDGEQVLRMDGWGMFGRRAPG